MAEEKVYVPEVIEETPFPAETSVVMGEPTSSKSGDVYSPTVSRENGFKAQKISTELLSRALNTRSKNILQEFKLQESGGFQVGNYKSGETGDLRITPNGITARDKTGITTFSIDGTTGDAVFKGSVQAGAVITGAVQVGDQSILIDGATKRMIFYDDEGKAVILIGEL